MKKVLMISCEGLGNGGVQTVMMNIVRSLSPETQFDMVLTTNERRHYDDEFESLGGRIFRFPVPSNRLLARFEYYLRGFRLYKGLRKIMLNRKYDVIHCHNEFYAAFCLKAAEKAGVPVRICHTHIINPKASHLQNIYNNKCRRMIKKYATHKIGCSKEACEALYGVNVHTIVVNNPYDSRKFTFCAKAGSESPVLMQIGAFSQNKNQLFSLDVVAEIKKKYPNVLFYIMGFGKGEYLSKIKEKIHFRGLKENVTFYTHDADAASILKEVDFLLFPSEHEGFGIVAIEAQSVGVHVYASDTIPKSVDCGGVSFFSLQEGAEKWAEKIVNDYEISHGEHRVHDCSAFSLDRVMEDYRMMYGGK